MNKKILILLFLFVAVVGLTISPISAGTFEFWCHGGSSDHKANWTQKFSYKTDTGEVIKKKGEYYKERLYLYEYTEHTCFHESHNKEYWPNGYSYTTLSSLDWKTDKSNYDYVKVKKGEVLKKSAPKYWKTVSSNGKVQKVYKVTKTVAVSSKQLKKVTSTTKKTIAYYKTFKMPTFKQGKYKWGTFKGNSFTYGNSYVGYYVNHLKEYAYYNSNHRIYKVSPKTWDLYGTNMFYKKPKSFTLYAYA